MTDAPGLFLAAARRNTRGLAGAYVALLGAIGWMHVDGQALALPMAQTVAEMPTALLAFLFAAGTALHVWLWRARPAASKDMSDGELYAAIRDKIQSRTVRVPFIELDLGSARARVALAIVVLALLVLMRHRLGMALRDGGASDDEPWFLLDTGDRIERAISAGYFVIVMSVSSNVAAALLIIGAHAAVVAFWAIGALLSVSIGARLLALRARRAFPPIRAAKRPQRRLRTRA